MNKINQLFTRKQRNILNIYFTAGYPNLGDTVPIIQTLAASGVDIIEIGIPYSDPLADGPTIQKSGEKALENGMTLDILFEQIATARQSTGIPLILMGYYNQVIQYGERRFFEQCAKVGVDGLILPDLPLAVYETEYQTLFAQLGLTISFLITPQTPDARIRKIDALSTAFIYVVSSYAITGAQTGISDEQIAYFQRITDMELQNPRLIGFGISDRATFDTACQHANGAIIGSAFIRALSDSDTDIATTVKIFVNNVR
jgi:tryptophan synthase alpha chain